MNFLYSKETKDKKFESFKNALLKGDIAGVRDNLKTEYLNRSLDYNNKRPIHVACERGFIDIVKLLIEKKVDIECETDEIQNQRPIHLACERGNIDIVKLLIEKNVKIECDTNWKKRPIHFACKSGNIDIVKLLIEKNVKIECDTNWAKRPIHIACKSGNIDIVKLLIEKNVDIECVTNDIQRPIHVACKSGNIDIVKLLIEKNVNIECETLRGETPLKFAKKKGHGSCVQLLEKIIKVNECVRQNKVSEFNQMYNSFIINDRTNNIAFSVMKRVIGNNNDNSHQIIKLMMERKIDDAEVTFLTNLLGVTEERETIALIKEFILYKCIRDHHAEGFHQYCSADTINGRHKIIGSSFLEIAVQHGCAAFIERILKRSIYEEEINEFVRQNKVSEFNQMYNSFIINDRMNNIAFSVMKRVIGNNNDNSHQIIKFMMERNIDDAEVTFLTNLLGVTEERETIALIKECILYKCIRDHHAEGFHQYCSADTINGRHKIIGSSFLEIAVQHGCAAFIEKILKRSIHEEEIWNRAKNEAELRRYDTIAKDIQDRKCMIVARTKRHFTLLHTAVTDNDEEMVDYILKEKIVDPNINHKTFGTALALAYSLSHTRCINVLQKYNVDTNTQNKFDETPLHEAISSGTLEQCEYLIKNSNNIDIEGFNHLTALHCAVMEGCIDLCTRLIQKGAESTRYVHFPHPQRAIQSEKRTSNNILSLSSEENPLTLCLKLHGTIYPCFLQQLDYDKSNCCDARKNSLLHLTALCYHPELTKLIIEKGALVNEVNKEENSCLSELLSETKVSIDRSKMDSMIAVVKELVENDANITMETGSGMTMIQCASKFNDQRLLLALLSKPSKISNQINVTEEDFKLAFTKRWFKYAEVLVKVMSDEILSTYITKEIIETSLTYANSNLTQLLFDRANANVQQSVIEDILYQAAMSEDENLFDHLKDVEIFCPKTFENGENLLTTLMKEKQTKYCLKMILSKNAHRFANTRNNNGQIPLQIAIELEELDVAVLLVSKTSEINSEDDQHETALMQLLKKISTCDSNMEHRLFTVIQSVLWMSENISVVTAEGCNVFDICKKRSLRAEIERCYKDNQSRRKPSQASQESAVQICIICANNAINCVLECGHPFCMECAGQMDICAVCRRGPVKYRRLYL